MARPSICNDQTTRNSRTTSRHDTNDPLVLTFLRQPELSAIATTSAFSPHAIPSWRADLGLMWTSLCEASVRQAWPSLPFMPFRASTGPLYPFAEFPQRVSVGSTYDARFCRRRKLIPMLTKRFSRAWAVLGAEF